MSRPTETVVVPKVLFHLGFMRHETNYDGYGETRHDWLEPVLMGKRPCRYMNVNDYVTSNAEDVTCPLCLKSKLIAHGKLDITPTKVKRSFATAESKLFWKSIEERAKEFEKKYSPEERLRMRMSMDRERYKRVIKVGREWHPSGPWKVDLA